MTHSIGFVGAGRQYRIGWLRWSGGWVVTLAYLDEVGVAYHNFPTTCAADSGDPIHRCADAILQDHEPYYRHSGILHRAAHKLSEQHGEIVARHPHDGLLS